MEDLFRRGIEEFNAQCFFEAHEVWEELWRGTSGPKKLFYQGLIETAVGFYHLENCNFRGACSQFGKALVKLEHYVPAYHGIDTGDLIQQVRSLVQPDEKGREEFIVRPEPRPAPRIRFS